MATRAEIHARAQAKLAKIFAEASTGKSEPFLGMPSFRYDGDQESYAGFYITNTERMEVRSFGDWSFIARCFSNGVIKYRRLKSEDVWHSLAKCRATITDLRRRISALHPDKLGRDQTPAELEEIMATVQALDRAREP